MNRREAIKTTTWWAGAGLLAPGIFAALQSCTQSDRKPDWKPLVLADEAVTRLEILGDIIVPQTDTPAASEVHVTHFIDLIVADVLSKSQGDSIVHVLNSLGSVDVNGRTMALEAMGADDQLALVVEIDREAYADNAAEKWDKTFLQDYRYLKSLILMAYYTSEKGVTENLNYVVIPGEFQSCIDVSTDDRIIVGNHM